MSGISLESISNRIRYESISKLANGIGNAQTLTDIDKILRQHCKFIVSSYRYLMGFYIEHQMIEFNFMIDFPFRKNRLSHIYEDADERPVIFNRDENNEEDKIVHHFFENEKNQAVVRVCSKIKESGFLCYFSTKDERSYSYNDIKFIKLIGEIILPKIQSILLRDKISQQNEDLRAAYKTIQSTNKELSGSIDYATMIQSALLPSRKSIKDNFPDNFILFLPRDKVSGDFYYSHEFNDYKVIIAADCTGHGVPGAILSIFGIQILREVCRNCPTLKPDAILSALDQKFYEYLLLGVSDSEKVIMNDGMDIAVVTVSYKTNQLLFSSASRPLNFFPKNKEPINVRGSRFPIGSNNHHRKKSFELYETSFEKGDRFYIYSDGYTDQFGGDRGKKFSSRRFLELLKDIQDKPLTEHEKILLDEHHEWKGNEEQIDDMLVIGVEL